MEKQKMIRYLQEQIGKSDAMSGEYVLIGRKEAEEIIRVLSGQPLYQAPLTENDGKAIFYCADCARSFRAVPEEDKTCFEKYGYHTWYAPCPLCKREVSRNDRYWR